MAAILDFWVIMMSLRQIDVRIGIPVVDVPEKVSSYMLFLCSGLTFTFSFYQVTSILDLWVNIIIMAISIAPVSAT